MVSDGWGGCWGLEVTDGEAAGAWEVNPYRMDLLILDACYSLNCICRSPGFIPVCSLGLSQVGRLNLGQNVSSLRYFTICGLQEGFEPFAINMKRDITMWFSKSLPQFIPVPTEHPHIEVQHILFSNSGSLCLEMASVPILHDHKLTNVKVRFLLDFHRPMYPL